jgi:hypothetical protein
MARVDAKVDASLLSDELTLPSGATVRGRFFSTYTEFELGEGEAAIGLDISFRCRATPEVLALTENELVRIYGKRYRFVRRYPNEGDHTERTILALGNLL